MSISYEISVTDGVMHVKASGVDDGPEEVKKYGLALIAEAVSRGGTKVLCDERELKYALDTLGTFESAKYIADLIPKLARVVIVCHPRYLKDGKFWETVAVNRGVQVRFTTDIEDAWKWIRKDN
jgi:hypothetical protein